MTRSSRKTRTFIIGFMLAATLCLGGVSSQSAKANTATRPLYAICFTDWYCGSNYEFKSPGASATNVDWMWDMLWWGNADITRVKNYLTLNYQHNNTGSQKFFFMYKGGQYNYEWPSDVGKKNDAYFTCTNEHVYTFGPSTLPTGGGLNVGNGWGYVIFGSTHQDKDEGNVRPWCDEEYGWSETSENLTGDRFAANSDGKGWWVVNDYAYLYNDQNGWDTSGTNTTDPGYEDHPHFWQNDGNMTVVWTPAI